MERTTEVRRKLMIDCVFPRAAILIFARAPVLGAVKTRLEPLLGAAGALDLHKALIGKAVATAAESRLAPVQLWVSSKENEEYFASLCSSVELRVQEGVDLGARMAHAAETALGSADCVVLIGADCPAVDAAYLRGALELLDAGEQVVIGPAEDGGYVLLGLREVPQEIFSEMPWGGSDIMQLTRQRLRDSGRSWQELPPSWDVDRPEDLPRLAGLLPGWEKG